MISDDVLGLHIITCQGMSDDEINDLIRREEICSLAKQRLMSQEISFQDYLDCLEVCLVNIDEYLNTANDNAHAIGF